MRIRCVTVWKGTALSSLAMGFPWTNLSSPKANGVTLHTQAPAPCKDYHTVTLTVHSVPGCKCQYLTAPSFRVKSGTSQSEGNSVPSIQTECPHALFSSLFKMLPCRSCKRESSFPPIKSTTSLLCLRTKHCKMSGAFTNCLMATPFVLIYYISYYTHHLSSERIWYSLQQCLQETRKYR